MKCASSQCSHTFICSVKIKHSEVQVQINDTTQGNQSPVFWPFNSKQLCVVGISSFSSSDALDSDIVSVLSTVGSKELSASRTSDSLVSQLLLSDSSTVELTVLMVPSLTLVSHIRFRSAMVTESP